MYLRRAPLPVGGLGGSATDPASLTPRRPSRGEPARCSSVFFAKTEEIASLDMGHCDWRFAILHEHRQHEVRSLARGGPLGGAALPTGIAPGQIVSADNAKHAIRTLEALLHPLGNVSTRGNLPLVNPRRMAEPFELLPEPERPVPVAAGVADKKSATRRLRASEMTHHRAGKCAAQGAAIPHPGPCSGERGAIHRPRPAPGRRLKLSLRQ
jgi:hypothetical protein